MITTANTHPELVALMRQLVAAITGKAADPWGVARGIQVRIGVAALSQIQQAFSVKSNGGTGADGISWPDLTPETKAYGRRITQKMYSQTAGGTFSFFDRISKERTGRLGKMGRRNWGKGKGTAHAKRPMLTAAHDKNWLKIFVQMKAMFMGKFGLSEDEANRRAAAIAWAKVKADGGQTKLALFGNRKVPILWEKGDLYRSLSPGKDGKTPSGAEHQIFETPPAQVIVGTKAPGCQNHYRRSKPRPFWPTNGDLPDVWWNHILIAARTGIAEAIQRIVK